MTGATVQLSLLRHAHAGDPARWKGPDADRPLSARGRQQAERLAAFLAEHEQRPDRLISSPKVRAIETAEAVARVFDVPIRNDVRLAAPLDLAAVDAILDDALRGEPGTAGTSRVMLVGHDPDFSEMAADITGAASLPIPKGAALRIDVRRPVTRGAGTLRWLVPPELLASD